ncbi:class I SAM-dependent methyltransferase [Luteolibacter sp. SL250]|uniref:class I SAM-dependent methyltransferase n=1 Tax=Luteolibacter sp. SL250 TaxID=2995170 RepID=UPI00227223EB|nr:class I SAM-dependent methyltransferase [Luteolibacter sp. SL250]WAC19652.1 class I SAM-dependent methyltransferase [Luteolibacter sp. SL250]
MQCGHYRGRAVHALFMNKSLGSLLLPDSFHERMQVERWHVHEFIRKEAMPLMKPGIKVLDAGSGREQEQYLRKELLATGATLHTCDFCEGPGVDFVADVSDLPFEAASYDIVLSTQVLEHVMDPQKVVSEMARVLKPGGKLFLTTPQSSPLHNLPWNFFNFTNLGLRLLFDTAGLKVVKEQAQGGHFTLLAYQLHWTLNVLRGLSLPGVLKKPLILFWQACFGFLFKVILIRLDRCDPDPLNTQGWNFLGEKPESGNPA